MSIVMVLVITTKRKPPRSAFKPGHKKLGGRKPGSKDKKVLLRLAAQELALKNLKTPLEILTEIAQTSRYEDTRVNAAKAAAPYVHKRMPQDINMTGSLVVKTAFADIVKGRGK